MSAACEVRIEYFPPPVHLRPYCTTFFLSEIYVEGGQTVEDYLFPEWATFRFSSNAAPKTASVPAFAEMRSGYKLYDTGFPIFGPRTQEIRFRIGSTRIWSVNLNPLGWLRYAREPADEYANVLADGNEDPSFAHLRPLANTLFGPEPDPDGELKRITDFLTDLEAPDIPNEERIEEIFIALLDPQLTTVSELADRMSIGQRTLERVCLNAFGFPPKLLLRRQRFMRSLTDFTLDPSLKWIGAMDALYHDQAQFVRDFRQFMGMTPSEYAALDKPIIGPVMRERVQYSKDFVRTLRAEGDRREYGVRD